MRFFTQKWLRYVRVFAIANPSVVCNVRVPYSGVETFGNISSPFYTLAVHCKILWRLSQGNPSVGGITYVISWHVSCFSTLKMLQHVWSLGPGNMSMVCLGWCSMTYTGWLFLSECSTSLLWQSIVVFGTDLQGISPTTVCQSLKLLVASTCDLPDVINCQFREFAAAPLGPVHFLSSDQQSGIHCLIICWPWTI